jgi:4-amino-4-deoxy-L-arabinose transferase-like glycosyltransferase
MTFGCSILPFFYFKSGIIDPWFNLFIFLSVYSYVLAVDTKDKKKEFVTIVLSASMLGLAILSKGPVSILVFGLVALMLFLLNGFHFGLRWTSVLSFMFTLSFVGGFWFILQILSGNSKVILDFINYQIRLFQTKDAGHGGFPLYHFIILLFGMFPASVFAIQGHRFKGGRDVRRNMHIAMVSLLWIVLLLFSIVKTKIVHYSSLTYFPISYLGAYAIMLIIDGKFRFRNWQRILLGFTGSVPALIIVLIPVFISKKDFFISRGLIGHSFTIGNLRADPGWTYFHSLIGLILIVALIITIWFYRKRQDIRIPVLFGATLLFTSLSMLLFTPGAENISQRAAIEFIREQAGRDVYMHSFYKSYATLFYFEQQIPEHKDVFNEIWLTRGEIDKEVYFVLRIDKKEEVLNRYPLVKVLYEKNGYVFCSRNVPEGKK